MQGVDSCYHIPQGYWDDRQAPAYHIASPPGCDSPVSTYSDSSLSSNPSPPTFSRPLSRASQPKKAKSHISRPPNAFLLFRSDFWAREKLKANPVERDHRDISRIAAHCWRNLDLATKQVYQRRALHLRELHQQQYPDYKYTPARKARMMKKSKDLSEEDERCARLAAIVMPDVVASTRSNMNLSHTSTPHLHVHQVDSAAVQHQSMSASPNALGLHFQSRDAHSLSPSDTQTHVDALIYQIYGCSESELQEIYDIFR
ncbi:hypothetical protein CC1G_13679 [Coprinopsis cinerea okayama7|uniref:HMG box domain-containing protein n=1 Tax=Coprinopsis cinerea (strain Okayama-7 / 130 / ATCC MYA-4618 / FGSC 9003) TaxID=240176 RepID=D6RJX4_COPC7|nr:hypothetical protein CC1G_13679 [Coprinopsis cinerea okayama7\|eukprot:XP_002912147.1 hypothetical protein CC1G_13679 [Coprinopsis cinerea okayama7\